MKLVSTLVLAVAIAHVCLAQSPAKIIPDFSFYNLDGSRYSSKDMPQRPSLFLFFDVTCNHCHASVRFFAKNAPKLKHITVHLISMDTKAAIKGFLQKNAPAWTSKPNVKVLQDIRYKFIALFKPVKYPSVFLYSRQKSLLIYTNKDNEFGLVLSQAQKLMDK